VDNKNRAIRALNKKGLYLISSEAIKQWEMNKKYYIDSRVNTKGVKTIFEIANK